MRKSVYLPSQGGWPGGYYPDGRLVPENPSSSYTSSRPKSQPSAYYDRSSTLENPGHPRPGSETLMVFEREFGLDNVLKTFGKRGPHLGDERDAKYWNRTGPPPSPPYDKPAWALSSCNLMSCNLICHCRECVWAHTQHRCEKMRDPQFQRHCVCRCPMCPVHGQHTMGQTTKHKHGPQKTKHTKGAPEDVDSSSGSSEDELRTSPSIE